MYLVQLLMWLVLIMCALYNIQRYSIILQYKDSVLRKCLITWAAKVQNTEVKGWNNALVFDLCVLYYRSRCTLTYLLHWKDELRGGKPVHGVQFSIVGSTESKNYRINGPWWKLVERCGGGTYCTGKRMSFLWVTRVSYLHVYILTARARPWAARTHLFGLINIPNAHGSFPQK